MIVVVEELGHVSSIVVLVGDVHHLVWGFSLYVRRKVFVPTFFE
jgi:hypothetical protein